MSFLTGHHFLLARDWQKVLPNLEVYVILYTFHIAVKPTVFAGYFFCNNLTFTHMFIDNEDQQMLILYFQYYSLISISAIFNEPGTQIWTRFVNLQEKQQKVKKCHR